VVTDDDGAASAPAATRGEVVAVLYARDVARLRRMEGVWPAEFKDEQDDGGGREEDGGGDDGGRGGADEDADDCASSDGSGLPPLEANPNRRRPTYETSSSEDD